MSKTLGTRFVGRNFVFRIWLDVVAPSSSVGNVPLLEHAQRVWRRKMGYQYMRNVDRRIP